jgi:hypothetical protein
MATRLTDGTDLNHVNNPVQIKLLAVLLNFFKILAVLLYLSYMAIIKAFTTQYKVYTYFSYCCYVH